jgi:hypothetical protein
MITTQPTSTWTKNDTAMVAVFVTIVLLGPFLLGMLLARGILGSYHDGYCAALNSEVLDGGRGGTPACVDPDGRVTILPR